MATRSPSEDQNAFAHNLLDPPEQEYQVHCQERIDADRGILAAERPERLTILLRAFQIGEIGIATIPIEGFAESGLQIKRQSPFARTFIIE